ncbi:MAG: cyanophycin synthetase, partial [Actinomycetota bacterium]|nr:cyanophycin synthetase [Actinomycetota bacterium]
VINTDDPYGSRLVEGITIEAVEVSRKMIEVTDERFTGSTLLWDGQKVNLAIPGRFNIDNALLAISTCQQLGVGQEDIISGLEAAKPVSGRFEVIEGGQGEPTIIVDYSHTPAGIENVLQAVRWIDPTAPLTVIFGCGGDRDRSKRPEMARAAESYADQVIITSDNPRNEDPKRIIEEAMAGFKQPDAVTIEIDRKLAIQTTINSSQAGEVIVIAGKGAETTQQIGDKLVPFDDRVIAREALRGGAV